MGAHGSIAQNLYLNLFQPHQQALWGDTVLLYTPAKQSGVECLEVRFMQEALGCWFGLRVHISSRGCNKGS